MINYSWISVPWNQGFIIEMLQSVLLLTTLHIQPGLVVAGFAYVLKCHARTEAVTDIFNLSRLRRSWVIVFSRLVVYTEQAGGKLCAGKLAVWAEAAWALLLPGSNPGSRHCFKGLRALILSGTSPLLSQSVSHFWLLQCQNSLIVNVWPTGFTSDCIVHVFENHFYTCVCFYFLHC